MGTTAEDVPGGGGKYMDHKRTSTIRTTNLESNDLAAAATSMVGKMLANPTINSGQGIRQVIVDSKYFTVRTTGRLDKDMLIDALRSELVKAANGRIRFIAREAAAMHEEERDLREEGTVGPGTTKSSAYQLGADYRLYGRITELAVNDGTRVEKFIQLLFEMIDVQTTEIVFSDTHKVKKQLVLNRVNRTN
ncbi:MAG: hypothetical protein GY851_02205 [bacterium]|nr:hypothetical protein [bacterium]